jgi:hypothetical protein
MPPSKKSSLPSQQLLIQAVVFGGLVLSLFEFNVRFLVSQPLFYVLTGALGVIALVSWKFPKLLLPTARFNGLFILLASAVMVLSLHGPSLQAKWGVIDDHEIMSYLGQDGKLTMQEWGQYVSQSGALKPGVSLRYRPVYDIFRLTEVGLWDSNPQPWYIVRLTILTLFIATAWYITQSTIGFAGGGLLATYILTGDYWKDIVARLGPSEIYIALGLLIFAFFTHRLVLKKQHWSHWLGIFVGFIIMIGAKENAVVLVPLLLIPLYISYQNKSLSKMTLMYGGLGFLFAGFVAWAVIAATMKSGQDVYAQATDASSRFSIAVLSLKTQQSKQLLVSLFLSGLFLVIVQLKAKTLKLTRPTLWFIGLQLGCWVLFISQFVFYNGYWPNHNRYDFPGVLYVPVYFISLVLFIKTIFEKTKLPPLQITAMLWAVFVGTVVTISMRGVVGTQVAVAQNLLETTKYTNRIKDLTLFFKNNQNASVIFESSNVLSDYERIYSYTVFLRAHGVSNPFFLKLNGYSSETVNPGLEQNLAKELEVIEAEGNTRFLPLLEADLTNCYSLAISGLPTTPCTPL